MQVLWQRGSHLLMDDLLRDDKKLEDMQTTYLSSLCIFRNKIGSLGKREKICHASTPFLSPAAKYKS